MSKEAIAKAKKELRKPEDDVPMSAEATVVATTSTGSSRCLVRVNEGQARHQRGREDPQRRSLRPEEAKERILEYLAVQAMVEKMKAPSSASWALPAWARLRWEEHRQGAGAQVRAHLAGRSPRTRRRSAATGARTSAPCRARIIQSLKKAGSGKPGLPAR